MSRRAITGLGVVAVGAGGYYLYAAGGDPKVAQKKIEHDAVSAKSSLKGERASGEAAKKEGEEWAQIAGAKIDSTVNDARNKINQADKTITKKAGEAESKFDKFKNDSAAQLEKGTNDTRKDINQAVDKFDKTVERKTSEAKSGISSWFGFGK
ncbi:hypothetical protein ACLMJK_000456 [Lecanora helva]